MLSRSVMDYSANEFTSPMQSGDLGHLTSSSSDFKVHLDLVSVHQKVKKVCSNSAVCCVSILI